MDKVRVGLIGAGSIGVRHMKAMEEVPEITLVAIADPSPVAVRIGAAQNIPIYPDAGAMLAQGGLDAVIIATPTERHHQDMMMALEARQTVLVEKPITATLAEADEVTRFAEQQGCHVLVGHQRRYYPCAAEAREIIAQGRIGKLMGVTGQWTTRKDDDYYSAAWRRDVKAGPILTNLIHEIDLLRFICGDIATVSAEVTHHDQEFDKEDAVAISMKFVNSAVGTFLLSDRTPTPWTWEMALGESVRFPKTGQNAIRFLGTEGALDFPNLTLWSHADSDGDWHDEITAEQIKTPFVDAYIAQCKHLCAIVRGTETPIIDARNGSKSLAATLAAASSAASGRRVILEQ
jgi:predicted dehydrogenase